MKNLFLQELQKGEHAGPRTYRQGLYDRNNHRFRHEFGSASEN
jgi:hypothetical protein